MRFVHAALLAMLILFAALQYNDPDWYYWGPVYLLAAAWSWLAMRQPERFVSWTVARIGAPISHCSLSRGLCLACLLSRTGLDPHRGSTRVPRLSHLRGDDRLLAMGIAVARRKVASSYGRTSPVMTPAVEHEEVILVDENDRPLGTAPKLAAHRHGQLHRAVSVQLQDPPRPSSAAEAAHRQVSFGRSMDEHLLRPSAARRNGD